MKKRQLDETRNENELLKLKLKQSLQTDSRRELSKLQHENDKLKCSQLKPSRITDNTYTSMTIRLLAIGKCTNTDIKWNDRELRTLILALQLPFVDVRFIQHHCLPRKFLKCCPSLDHSYLNLTFLFFRSLFRCN